MCRSVLGQLLNLPSSILTCPNRLCYSNNPVCTNNCYSRTHLWRDNGNGLALWLLQNLSTPLLLWSNGRDKETSRCCSSRLLIVRSWRRGIGDHLRGLLLKMAVRRWVVLRREVRRHAHVEILLMPSHHLLLLLYPQVLHLCILVQQSLQVGVLSCFPQSRSRGCLWHCFQELLVGSGINKRRCIWHCPCRRSCEQCKRTSVIYAELLESTLLKMGRYYNTTICVIIGTC